MGGAVGVWRGGPAAGKRLLAVEGKRLLEFGVEAGATADGKVKGQWNQRKFSDLPQAPTLCRGT